MAICTLVQIDLLIKIGAEYSCSAPLQFHSILQLYIPAYKKSSGSVCGRFIRILPWRTEYKTGAISRMSS